MEKEPPQAFPSGAATQRGLCSSLLTQVDFSEAAIPETEARQNKVTEHVPAVQTDRVNLSSIDQWPMPAAKQALTELQWNLGNSFVISFNGRGNLYEKVVVHSAAFGQLCSGTR